jgi:AhpD family alkylhydroperoxidase
MFLEQEADRLYQNFAENIYNSPSLENKVKEMIAMACSVMADCMPCIEYHGTKAVETGATKDEIHEALAIAMTIAAGSKKAKYSSLIPGILKD